MNRKRACKAWGVGGPGIENEARNSKAKPEDAEALGGLHAAVWRTTYTRLMPDAILAAVTPESCAKMLHRFLVENSRVEVYKALADGEPVGLLIVNPPWDEDLD